ncbi:MAG: MATE family efflux transporter [Bacteroides sp.]|nr:MATE family efflux transporter [Bacillota bacterium]MCM1393402.1 MATE family efflux transporter [[Eubacterium] siraeum]MCM1455388.1 MATE family efflux transporter [Bacteroides sp.]
MAVHLSDHFTYKKLFRAVIPSIAMMIFTSLYTIVDGVFVSNMVGKDPFAGLNLIYPIISAIGAVGFMLGAGGSALVAKTLGEGNKERANKIFSMVVYFTAIVGVILSVVGALVVEPVAKLLGADETLLPHCVTYGRILLAAIVAFMLQNMFQAFFIVAEKPLLGFLISVGAGVTNMILDAAFIAGAKLGIAGAAFATIASQIVGALIPIVYFSVKNKSPLRLVLTKFEIKPLVRTCTNGSSEFLSNISISIVNMLYNMQLLKYIGTDGVAAYGVIQYLAFVFLATFFGYAIGSAPIISYHYGAQNHDELKNLLKKSLIIMVGIGALMTALSEGLAKPLSMIFVSYDKALLDMTTFGMRLFGVSFIISGLSIFLSSFFTALNNGLVSAIISFMRTLVFQILAIMVMPLLFGVNGIWTAVILAEGLSLIVSITCLILNRKKYKY